MVKLGFESPTHYINFTRHWSYPEGITKSNHNGFHNRKNENLQQSFSSKFPREVIESALMNSSNSIEPS